MIAPYYLKNVCTVLCLYFRLQHSDYISSSRDLITNFRLITSFATIDRQPQPVPNPL